MPGIPVKRKPCNATMAEGIEYLRELYQGFCDATLIKISCTIYECKL